MFIIENSALINILFLEITSIKDAFNNRSMLLSSISLILFIIWLILFLLYKARNSLSLSTAVWIRNLCFFSLLFAVVFFSVSLYLGSRGGGNTKPSETYITSSSVSDPSELTSFSIRMPLLVTQEAAQKSIREKKTAYIRIYGPSIYFSNHLCETPEALLKEISYLTDDVAVFLIDDYAEDQVFSTVENELGSNHIRYEILLSIKG